MDGSVLYPGFWRFLWGTYDPQKIFWDRGWGSSEPRKFANSRCQRSFHFSNVLWVNILHQVLAPYIWCEKLVPQVRISARWGSFDTRKFANSRFQSSFRFLYHILHCWYSSPGPPPSSSRHKWISPGGGVLGVYSKLPEGISRELWWRVSL